MNARRSRMRSAAIQAQRERERIEVLRQDTEIRKFWPEIEEAAQLAARLDRPDRQSLGNACRQVVRARGRDGTYSALIEVAAVALRWAGILSKRGRETGKEHEAA